MYLSLRVKILFLLFVLISSLGLIFNESATQLIEEKTEETFQERLYILTDSVRAYWEAERNQLLRNATLYAESEKIVSYASFGLVNLLQREINRLVADSGFSELEIRLKSGLMLTSGAPQVARLQPLNENDPLLTLTKIQFEEHGNALDVCAIVPIQKLGEFLGLLTLRRRIDDARVRKMARNIQADVTLAVKGELIASSLAGQARRDLMMEIYRQADPKERFFTLALAGKVHSIGTVDLARTTQGWPIRMNCSISQEKMLSLVEKARQQNVHLTVLALLIAFILSFLFSERVLIGRIRQIRDGSLVIAQGDLSLRLPHDSRDELGDLARSFNDMTAALMAKDERLRHYIASLEELKNYIQNILGSLGTAVITWNRAGRVETLNPAAERELGEFFHTLKGSSIRDFLRPATRLSRGSFLKALRDLRTAGALPRLMELEFDLGPNRGYKSLQGSLTYLREANGEPYGMVLTLDDITQRRIIEQQLYHADKLSSIGQLAASVAHEIKNPLASIKTLGQLLQEDTPPEDSRREYIDVIVSEVNRLNGVVEQLLKYAKPEGSSFRQVKFAEILQPVLALVNHELERHRIELAVEHPPDLELFVDAEKTKQVFLNLIFNALQAMPTGGKVKIRGSADTASPWVICQVEDSGLGMPPEVCARVFEPFFTTRQRGTGLGLAIVKKIIDLHGGKIEVKSRAGEGTTFTMYFPLERKDT